LLKFFKKKKFDLGIILGARILDEDIIKTFKIGILNLHPGLLPDNRGLDTYQWAIINMIPQGVTSNLIDSKIDGGKILIKKK
jgi:methionyl-tRNA formyltransferase